MKVSIGVGVIVALFISPAMAADMPLKAPPLPPPPVYSWTGFYIGLNAGYTWSDANVYTNASNLQFCTGALVCVNGAATAQASALGATGVFPTNPRGFIGGGQIGYDRQFDSYVAGIEADLQGIANGHSSPGNGVVVPYNFSGAINNVASFSSVTRGIDDLGTLRGRFGFLVTPGLLVYGTGGLAYGRVSSNTNIAQQYTPVNPFNILPTNFGAASTSDTRAGWTAGGGLEWILARQWSVKAEYLYYDLGHVTNGGLLVSGFINPAIVTAPTYYVNNFQSTTHFNGDIVRLGLNYKFDWGGPVMARH